MLVRINGKEVEVGPGRTHKKDCGCIGKFFQSSSGLARNQKSGLIINGHEVDMNNPDDVQKAMKLFRIFGSILLCIGGMASFPAAIMVGSTNFGIEYLIGIIPVSIVFLAGMVFAFLIPRSLNKRLQELKRRGKVPQKNEKALLSDEKESFFKVNYDSFKINGKIVDMNDPDEVQKAVDSVYSFQRMVLLFGGVFLLVSVLKEGILSGFFLWNFCDIFYLSDKNVYIFCFSKTFAKAFGRT